MIKFDIVNFTGRIDFQQRIALAPLADSLADREEVNQVNYDPSELHLIHSWLNKNDTYVAFYKDGTCSITGVDSLDGFNTASNIVSNMIKDIIDFDVDPIVTVSNIVTTAEIDNIPSLEAIAVELGLEGTEYEPEQFPALVYRSDGAVFLIFASGKIVCTGLTDLKQISSSIEDITAKIERLAVP